MKTLQYVYLVILHPRAIENSIHSKMFVEGTASYDMNKGLDSNKDGIVTPDEAVKKLQENYKKGMTKGYIG